jgi:hypothetical protein
MSQQELITTYREGGMSRRTLIRRLVASGVSLGAAVSYAHLFAPKAEASVPGYEEFYPPEASVRIVSNTVNGVVHSRHLRVFLRIDEGASATLRVFIKMNGRLRRIGIKTVEFPAAGARTVGIPLGANALAHLARRNRKWFRVTVAVTDENGPVSTQTSKTLDDLS